MCIWELSQHASENRLFYFKAGQGYENFDEFIGMAASNGDEEVMKRLCIYLTYDKENVIDGYIGYMLKELKSCVNHLAVVCNHPDRAQGEEILEEYADEIFHRENIGFDAGGFKDALCNLIGWDMVTSYDELMLVNDSFYGPFCPMREIFEEMESRQIDFWGLSKLKNVSFPEHIQSFFIAIHQKMLRSTDFRKYWEEMSYYTSLWDTVLNYEVNFTGYFAQKGFSYDCLADIEKNCSANPFNNFFQYFIMPYELLRRRGFPVLKRNAVAYAHIQPWFPAQDNLKAALAYIDEETDYDVKLIWENLLRSYNLADLQKSIRLYYIFSAKAENRCTGKELMAVVFVKYTEAAPYVLDYLKGIRRCCKIKIYSEKEEILHPYLEKGYQGALLKDEAMCRDILKECSESDYVCVIHDTDVTGEIKPSYIGKASLYRIWENLLGSEAYILNVIQQFEKETKLGLLAPPIDAYGKAYADVEIYSGEAFKKVTTGVREWNLKCGIAANKRPLTDSDSFWIRGEILKKVCEKEQADISYLPYLWSYLAQDAGFYSGIAESAEYAGVNITNLEHVWKKEYYRSEEMRRKYINEEEQREAVVALLQDGKTWLETVSAREHVSAGDEGLQKITDLREYFSAVKTDPHYVVVLSCKDEGANHWRTFLEVSGLPLRADLAWRDSYVAVVDGTGIPIDQRSQDGLTVNYEFGVGKPDYSVAYTEGGIEMKMPFPRTCKIRVKSKGFTPPSGSCISEILVDNVDYSMNRTGLNIVVVDKESGIVADSFNVNTYSDALLRMNRR